MAIPPQVIAAGVSALGSLASNALNQSNASENLSRNIRANKSYQSWLMAHGPSIQMRGIKAAGINPALSGESGVGSATMPSFSNASVPQVDFSNSLSGLLGALTQATQAQVNEQAAKTGAAQENLLNAQAQGQQTKNKMDAIDLHNKQGRQNEFDERSGYFDPFTGDPIDPSAVNKWREDHFGLEPDVYKYLDYGTEGRLEAQAQKDEFITLAEERKARVSDAKARSIEADARESEARLKKAVADGQLNMPDVLTALKRMPRASYDQILKDIEYKGKLITWQELNNERFRDSDFGKFVDKMASKDLSFGDKLLAALTLLGYAFMNK